MIADDLACGGRSGAPVSEGAARTPAAAPKRSRLWLWLVALAALWFAAWTAWFIVAAQHHVAEVPLVTTH